MPLSPLRSPLILDKLANDQLTIRLGLDPLTRTTIERATGPLSRALVLSALLVGGGNVLNAVLRWCSKS